MTSDSQRTWGLGALLVLALGVIGYLVSRPAPVAERLRYQPQDGSEQPVMPMPEGADIRGRTYVPAYSHGYVGSGTPVLFAITLSVRNVDPARALVLTRVDYHATEGQRLRAFLTREQVVPPLGTAEFLVEREDEEGGSGANFMVEWRVEPGGHRPLAEAVMLGTVGPSGFAFTSVGVDVSEREPASAPASVETPAPDATP